jgi:transcriptional regulator with XRE-family HTH domain
MTLEQLCAARGLALEQLAERAHVPLSTVAELAAGTRRAQPTTLGRLAGVLGLDRDRLAAELSAARRARPGDPEGTRTTWR